MPKTLWLKPTLPQNLLSYFHSLFWIPCSNFPLTAKVKTSERSWTPVTPSVSIVTKSYSPSSTPGLWLLPSVLDQASSISYPDYCSSSLMNSLPLILVPAISTSLSSSMWPPAVIFSICLWWHHPLHSHMPPKENLNSLEQTHGHIKFSMSGLLAFLISPAFPFIFFFPVLRPFYPFPNDNLIAINTFLSFPLGEFLFVL